MSAQPTSAHQDGPSQDERVVIAIATDTSAADHAIRRVGWFSTLKDLPLSFILEQAIATHEDLKRYGRAQQYEAEHETVHDVQRICRQGYCCLINDSLTASDRLGSLTVGECVAPAHDVSAGLEVSIGVRELAAPVIEEPSEAEETPLAAEPEEPAPGEPAAAAAAEAAAPIATEPAPQPVAEPPAEPDRQLAPAAQPELAAEPVPEKKPRVSKHELLLQDYRSPVAALSFDGLFVNNLRARNELDPRLLTFMHQRDVSKVLMRANRLLQDGSYDRALEMYELLANGQPDNADYWFLYGKVLLFARDWEKALEVLGRAQELGHQSAGSVIRRVESFRSVAGAYPASSEGLRNLLGEVESPKRVQADQRPAPR